MLESMDPANSNVVHGFTISVLVTDSRVLVQDMAITDPINLVAGVAVHIFVFMEPECKAALGILHLLFFSHKGNAEKSSEEVTDMMSGIVATDVVQKGGTCKPLWNHLVPFDNGTIAMNRDFRGLQQRPIKSDGLRSHPFADGINLLGARPHTLAGKVS
jgi:hypothetical protein